MFLPINSPFLDQSHLLLRLAENQRFAKLQKKGLYGWHVCSSGPLPLSLLYDDYYCLQSKSASLQSSIHVNNRRYQSALSNTELTVLYQWQSSMKWTPREKLVCMAFFGPVRNIRHMKTQTIKVKLKIG